MCALTPPAATPPAATPLRAEYQISEPCAVQRCPPQGSQGDKHAGAGGAGDATAGAARAIGPKPVPCTAPESDESKWTCNCQSDGETLTQRQCSLGVEQQPLPGAGGLTEEITKAAVKEGARSPLTWYPCTCPWETAPFPPPPAQASLLARLDSLALGRPVQGSRKLPRVAHRS